MRSTNPPIPTALRALSSFFLVAFLGACGDPSSSGTSADAGSGEADGEFPPHDNTAEVEEYYRTKVVLPTDVFEALEAGRITPEAIDERTAAGEFPRFFRFATPGDIPGDLDWMNGANLPDIGSPDARKGGTQYTFMQDFPRTLRLVGPDSNGSFRNYILDDTTMQFAHRHPNVTEVTETGFRYYPGLAEEWALDRDNKTVYVRINPDARWSDGEAITVEDVFFLFFFFQSDYINAPWYNNWYNRNYTNITRYDDLTFSISLPEAKPDMLGRVVGLMPVPRHFYKELGEDFVERYQWRFQVTTAPYIVKTEHINKGRSIRLTRNDDWWARDNKFWRNRFNYDAIQINVIRDTDKAFEAFKKGEMDGFGMSLPEFHYDKLPNSGPLVANGYIHKYTYYNDVPRTTPGLWINTSQPLLSNLDVRLGINFATNWDRVIAEYFRGDYRRLRTTNDGYGEFSHPTLEARPFDIDRALEHFAKAGFARRGNDGVLVNADGQRLSFTLTNGSDALKEMLPILQEEALKAGLEFRLENLDPTAAWKKVQEKEHEISFTGFGRFPEMYPRYWETWHGVNAYHPDGSLKKQTNNLCAFANEEMNGLIEAYRASESAEEMQAQAHRMEEILHAQAPWVPGFVRPFYRIASWRWVKWPEDFNVKISYGAGDYYLSWMIPEEKDATLRALRTGETFKPVLEVFDEYNMYD